MKKIIWLNGTFGVGKTTLANQLNHKIEDSIIFDPETVGAVITKVIPKRLQPNNFQDLIIWRIATYYLLKIRYTFHRGIIIVPMTICNPVYYDEIIGKLLDNNIIVDHFILCASNKTIIERLSKRELSDGTDESFAREMLIDCSHSLETQIPGIKIVTTNASTDALASYIINKEK